MKKLLSMPLYLITSCCLLFSCVDQEKDYSENRLEENDTELNVDFDFSLKTEKQISITAKDADNNFSQGVKVGVYSQEPYTEDGVFKNNISPLFVGYTDSNGQIGSSIVVPQNISKLYVLPLTSGFGEMQVVNVSNYMSAQLQGATFNQASNTRTDAIENVIPTKISGLYNAYSIYADSEVDNNGIPLIGGSSLVSKETLSPTFINKVNSWYPEKVNVQTADLSKNSDLEVNDENGAEIWITYIGDGGFYIDNKTIYNTLFYYNYQDGDLTGRDDINSKVHMTLALPNTNELYCPSGLKIQLLYWDKNAQTYSKVFPKGSHIAFAVARAGYKKNGTTNVRDAYNFKNTENPKLSDPSGFYYSTPALNFTSHAQSVTRVVDDYNCCVSGFDIRRSDDPKADFDFNDVLFKITSSPVKGALPKEDIPIIEEENILEAIHGTLAFEDQWPAMGDYDFNDAVINYTYSVEKNQNNAVAKIKMTFTPIAKGAAAYTRIGFGIELPIANSDVESVTGAYLESGDELATLILWDENNLYLGSTGFINSYKNTAYQSFDPVDVEISLKEPINNFSMLKLNPFIFVNGRSREIHLVDYKPTAKMDLTILGTQKDRSDISKGIYYRMDNAYPWALDIPRSSADAPAWRYPKEKSIISSAYLNYDKWVLNQSDLSWFESDKSSNINEDELY